jgi:hypothetical protein
MSQLNVDTIKKADGTGNLSVPAETGTVVTTASPSLGRRNLIINGAMQVAQRGNTSNDNGVFVADRFQFRTSGLGGAGAVIAASTQSTVVPSGFASALKTNVTTAGSGFSADDRDGFAQKLETQDVAHLFDAGNSFTLSFWVRSSLATTYGLTLNLLNRDTTSTGELYATSYTINSADTWEKKTITIPATTSSRSGGDDNSTGLHIYWNLEMISGGSRSSATANSWVDNATSDQVVSAAADTGWMSSTHDFYITGVQLEVGSVATPFEHRSYGDELALCQRYFYKSYPDGRYAGFNTADDVREGACVTRNQDGLGRSANHWPFRYPVTMRAKPTITVYSLNGTSGSVSELSGSLDHSSNITLTGFYDTDHQGGWQVVDAVTALGSLSFGGFHVYANAEL